MAFSGLRLDGDTNGTCDELSRPLKGPNQLTLINNCLLRNVITSM